MMPGEVINLKGLMSTGKSIQAALDQSHKSVNTNSSARRRLAVVFGERGEEDSANTEPRARLAKNVSLDI